jgi:hypothetical protein
MDETSRHLEKKGPSVTCYKSELAKFDAQEGKIIRYKLNQGPHV